MKQNHFCFSILAIAGVLTLGCWIYLHIGGPMKLAAATPYTYGSGQKGIRYIGPGCLADYSKKYSLYLPAGWYANSCEGSTRLSSYDPTKIIYDHGAPVNLPQHAISFDLRTNQLEKGQKISDWLLDVVNPLNPTDIDNFLALDRGEIQALAWEKVDGSLRVLALQPGQESWMISTALWDISEESLVKIVDILSSLDTTGDCAGRMKAEPTFAAEFTPYPAPLPFPTTGPYPDAKPVNSNPFAPSPYP